MNDAYLIILTLSSFLFFFSLVSKYIKEKFYLPESFISIFFGILLGPNFLNLLNTSILFSKIVMYNISRLILCIQTMNVAISLPRLYIISKWQSLFFLVVIIGIVKCICSFFVIILFKRYEYYISWSLASSLTPTDPILSSSIIKGKFATKVVPKRIRQLLTAESGINDGLGIIILFLGFNIKKFGILDGLKIFIIDNLFIKIFISCIFGILLGIVTKACFKFCHKHRLIGLESFPVHSFLLVFISIGIMEFIGGSDLICIFSCGIVFSSDEWVVLESRNSNSQELLDNILSTIFFVLFGAYLKYKIFKLGTIVSALIIIIVRRPAICYFLYRNIPELRNKKEGLFVGWFGPIGVGAIYYALLTDMIGKTNTIEYASVVVFLSIVLHGLTVPIYSLCSKYLLNNSDRQL